MKTSLEKRKLDQERELAYLSSVKELGLQVVKTGGEIASSAVGNNVMAAWLVAVLSVGGIVLLYKKLFPQGNISTPSSSSPGGGGGAITPSQDNLLAYLIGGTGPQPAPPTTSGGFGSGGGMTGVTIPGTGGTPFIPWPAPPGVDTYIGINPLDDIHYQWDKWLSTLPWVGRDHIPYEALPPEDPGGYPIAAKSAGQDGFDFANWLRSLFGG